MKKIFPILCFLIAFYACKNDAEHLSFSEVNFTSEEFAIIEINIPKFDGNTEIAHKINTTIEYYISRAIARSKDESIRTITEAVTSFDEEFKTFNEEFSEASQPWEAFVDGEVTYQSSEVISVAINTYLNTGGAHGNSVISFLNFNPSNGEAYNNSDLINDFKGLTSIAEKHYKKALEEKENSENFNFQDGFILPETLGFNEDGVIILFNNYEIADYADGMMEFTIPYSEVNKFITVN